MTAHVRVGGAFKDVNEIYTRVGGVWKSVEEGYTRVGGVWKKWFEPSGSYSLISTQVLGTTTATINFNNIPQTFKHLELRISASATSEAQFNMRINGGTTSYSWHNLIGDGGSVTTANHVNRNAMTLAITSGLSNQPLAHVISLFDYSSTIKNTVVKNLSGFRPTSGSATVRLSSGVRANTNAVSSINILTTATGYTAGSRFSLYGIEG